MNITSSVCRSHRSKRRSRRARRASNILRGKPSRWWMSDRVRVEFSSRERRDVRGAVGKDDGVPGVGLLVLFRHARRHGSRRSRARVCGSAQSHTREGLDHACEGLIDEMHREYAWVAQRYTVLHENDARDVSRARERVSAHRSTRFVRLPGPLTSPGRISREFDRRRRGREA